MKFLHTAKGQFSNPRRSVIGHKTRKNLHAGNIQHEGFCVPKYVTWRSDRNNSCIQPNLWLYFNSGVWETLQLLILAKPNQQILLSNAAHIYWKTRAGSSSNPLKLVGISDPTLWGWGRIFLVKKVNALSWPIFFPLKATTKINE